MKSRSFALPVLDRRHGALVALLSLLAVLPWILPPYVMHLSILVLLYIYWAQAWNIVAGIAGSFGFFHPIFIGAGAYTSTLLFTKAGVSPWLGMLAGAALAIVFGVAFTYIAIRPKLPKLSFALVSLAIVFIAIYVADSIDELGAHDRGVQIPYAPSLANFQFESKVGYYYIILALSLIIMVSCWHILRSGLGLRFRALHDNERAAAAVGVDPVKYHLIAVAISAFFTALGGSFYAQFIGSLTPTIALSVTTIITMILFVAVGGLGTLWGPVVGVVLLMPIGEALRTMLPQYQSLPLFLYGVVVIVILTVAPNGLVSLVASRRSSDQPRQIAGLGESPAVSLAGTDPRP